MRSTLGTVSGLLLLALVSMGQDDCDTAPEDNHAEVPPCVPGTEDVCDSFDNDCDCSLFGPNDDNGDGVICGPGDTNVDEDCTDEPVDEDLLTITDSSLNVVSSDYGTSTVLMELEINGASALTIDPLSGMAYVASESEGAIYMVDPAAGTYELLVEFNGPTTNVHALAMAPLTAEAPFVPGEFYGVSLDGIGECNPNCFVHVDMETGDVTPLGGMATDQLRGMAFNPLLGTLQGYDQGNHRVVEIAADGTVFELFTIEPSNPEVGEGANAMFSLGFDCQGNLHGVSIDYMLLLIDFDVTRGIWVDGGDADLFKEVQGMTGYCL